MGKCFAIDLETTGLNPELDEIISICILECDSFKKLAESKNSIKTRKFIFSDLNPERTTKKMKSNNLFEKLYKNSVQNYPQLYRLLKSRGYEEITIKDFCKYLLDAFDNEKVRKEGTMNVILGQYVRFDIKFLQAMLRNVAGTTLNNILEVDTRTIHYLKQLTRSDQIKRGGSTEDLIKFYNIPVEKNAMFHDAEYDIKKTIEILYKILELNGGKL